MSSSTVSRAVKGKYIQTRWGIYSLRYFFGGGIRTEEGTVSAAQIRAVIGRMIAKEDKAHPFSDKKIEMMLKEVCQYLGGQLRHIGSRWIYLRLLCAERNIYIRRTDRGPEFQAGS